MARYRDSRVKIIRRLGKLPGFTTKFSNKLNNNVSNLRKLSQYGLHLREKQKLRYNYGVSEKELIKYVKKSRKKQGNASHTLLRLLEMRLDNIIYKSGLVPTISCARQLISHGHVLVNGHKVTISGFSCNILDRIQIRTSLVKRFSNSDFIKPIASHIFIKEQENVFNIVISSFPNSNEIGFPVNVLLVLEYYSGK